MTTVRTPEPLADRYDRGLLFFDSGDFAAAARILAPVVEAEPTHVAARLLLARAHYHSAALPRAERELRVVVDQAPTEVYAHLLLGRTLQRLGRSDEGAAHLRIAAAMGGEDLTSERRLESTVD